MIDINPQAKKLILSIDGGGMRGMIAVAMLAELETLTGKPCSQLFDMVAGTSTGAIIAAGIGLGYTAQELLEEVYRTRLPESFRAQPNGILLALRYLFTGLRHLYDLKPFVDIMGSLAQGRTVGDFTRPIVFMTTRDSRTANIYYIVSAGPGAPMFADWPVIGAVAASGAEPIYFPPVLGNLLDGGVGVYSNPCLVATIEAMEYIGALEGFADGNVIHFSVGTGFADTTVSEGGAAAFLVIRLGALHHQYWPGRFQLAAGIRHPRYLRLTHRLPPLQPLPQRRHPPRSARHRHNWPSRPRQTGCRFLLAGAGAVDGGNRAGLCPKGRLDTIGLLTLDQLWCGQKQRARWWSSPPRHPSRQMGRFTLCIAITSTSTRVRVRRTRS